MPAKLFAISRSGLVTLWTARGNRRLTSVFVLDPPYTMPPAFFPTSDRRSAFDSVDHSEIRNPKSAIPSGAMLRAFFCLRQARHCAEQRWNNSVCPALRYSQLRASLRFAPRLANVGCALGCVCST